MHFVYILASRHHGALYTGLTSSLARRVDQHRSGAGSVHTAKYKNKTLVWFEGFALFADGLAQERRIKRWHRAWKVALIERGNPEWRDLSALIPYD